MKRKFEITDASSGASFGVRVVTRTSKSEVVGIQDDGIIKVRLMGSPDDGSANQELITLLANVLEVTLPQIEIVAGEKSRDKLIIIDGVSPEQLEQKLHKLGSTDDAS